MSTALSSLSELHRRRRSLRIWRRVDFSDGSRIAAQVARLRAGLLLEAGLLGNAFARALYRIVPELASLPGVMREAGAETVAITGAGPAHYAVVEDGVGAERIAARLRQRLGDWGRGWWLSGQYDEVGKSASPLTARREEDTGNRPLCRASGSVSTKNVAQASQLHATSVTGRPRSFTSYRMTPQRRFRSRNEMDFGSRLSTVKRRCMAGLPLAHHRERGWG